MKIYKKLIIISKHYELYCFFTLIFTKLIVDGVADKKQWDENQRRHEACILLEYRCFNTWGAADQAWLLGEAAQVVLIEDKKWPKWMKEKYKVISDSYLDVDKIKEGLYASFSEEKKVGHQENQIRKSM